MKLSLESLKNKEQWLEKNYQLPLFDLEKVAKKTLAEPTWLHFGAGNLLRAFPAAVYQDLLDRGEADTGIIVCEAFDEEIIEKAYAPYDNLTLLVTLNGDGSMSKKVVASITESLAASKSMPRLTEIFKAPTLQMVSFTITEKGYSVKDAKGEFFQAVAEDIAHFTDNPKSIIAKLTYLCYQRFSAGKLKLALVSLDNCSHNGTLLFEAVKAIAAGWIENGFVPKEFLAYIEDPDSVSFTWSMIDKITPRPSEIVANILAKDGFPDTEIVCTSKNSYTAAFVNAESAQYLAIEDRFPNKRPALDQAGILFADRNTIDRIEKMKVCTCLNPLHTVLAVYGCLLGYDSISGEMKDKELKAFVEKVGYIEGLPVVVNPGIINPKNFIDEVINERFPNPFVPDTPQRIACDTSQKIPVRFGETLKAYIAKGEKDLSFLTYIPLFFAGWLRYLMAVDDNGNAFAPSPDPLLTTVQKFVEGINLGDKGPFTDKIKPLLSDSAIFGVNLYEYGLGDKVEAMFAELIGGKGSIRKTLQKYLQD